MSLDGPTIPAPDGYESNLDNPPNGNHIAIPVISICVIISAIFYVIRFYAKYLAKKVNVADCEFGTVLTYFAYVLRLTFA